MRTGCAAGRMAHRACTSERGMALLTVMIIMLIMTVLGIAAITVGGLKGRMAASVRTKEVASVAVQSCEVRRSISFSRRYFTAKSRRNFKHCKSCRSDPCFQQCDVI